jgi:hypothetical protein
MKTISGAGRTLAIMHERARRRRLADGDHSPQYCFEARASLGQRSAVHLSLACRKRLEDEGLMPSIVRVRSSYYNNALPESFVATLKTRQRQYIRK